MVFLAHARPYVPKLAVTNMPGPINPTRIGLFAAVRAQLFSYCIKYRAGGLDSAGAADQASNVA
jgi:hypothetical protein